jgi:hypothetical protein
MLVLVLSVSPVGDCGDGVFGWFTYESFQPALNSSRDLLPQLVLLVLSGPAFLTTLYHITR